ncbi:MAG: S49 family peptidase [Alphaproteobacteria bacterium]|nr:S49 family peptidase [Alphaproteobacteria bacterium]MBP7758235.1 S49 family peptidase [Alphaproteobacteria bacterium]MBP7761622.1 S49 family peptidase [Alphaproteobacteria bacterium]MBP7904026.1 S49 family peptidase [Alphaproteobacteria bacterium]
MVGQWFAPKPKIAVLRLAGVIRDTSLGGRSGISHERFAPLIEKAFEAQPLKAIALVINSPGGSGAQSALIAGQIRALAEEKKIPVLAFVEDLAASGGYWLACAADEIYAQKMSIVGSVGVISASFGMKDLIEKAGVERRIHTAGKDKSFLDPFEPEKAADVKRLSEIQKDMHAVFKDWVRERRGEKLKGEDKDLFEGAFWTGGGALENGFIDGFAEMRAFCRARFGKDVKFLEFSAPRKWWSALFDLRGGGVSSASSLPDDLIDAVEDRLARSQYGL